TDTTTKVAAAPGDEVAITGVAKGAAMLAPNMATMLAFIATDARLESRELQTCLTGAVDASFNRISVDACESTNDSVFLFSTGRRQVRAEAVASALTSVCSDLARQMVRDAEGGSRLVRVEVVGARDDETAARLARAVAASALWRAALYGADPNWGRVVAALGAADRSLDIAGVDVAIGSETVFATGEPFGSLVAAAKEMQGDETAVHCRVGSGTGRAEILTCDLSPEYVTLNATGTS
ncbi:MAG: bifunctional ornithine acetyltransferase/N-acetylglutamate synthase, partial [Actinomycetota bacterium]|nr:bifunctional ornithine acetyltransferase/N-acetylglutamate synthase [Actinomycetota bacterium]